ncbi:hypothetical protein Dsin_024080 [Dipteronia sinensis]|uniref:Uncharacterized protein n=1 Tax=Dipteronia sinensis TaxID=43782 RepID=A0AAE0E189_9ROSI|nr:hypothetical protein Dsin_024080 [Dipteronia sinensis]
MRAMNLAWPMRLAISTRAFFSLTASELGLEFSSALSSSLVDNLILRFSISKYDFLLSVFRKNSPQVSLMCSVIAVPFTWIESDPKLIANPQMVKLHSFDTKIHKVDTLVSYKNDEWDVRSRELLAKQALTTHTACCNFLFPP